MRRSVAILIMVSFLLVALALVRWGEKKPEEPALSVTEVLGNAPSEGFARATASRRFYFPADHGPHPEFRNEWWYFTGNLHTAAGRRFGYQLTFFRTGLTSRPTKRSSRWGAAEVYLAHFAITDVGGNRILAAERFSRAMPGLAEAGGKPLMIRVENWTALQTLAEPWGMQLSADNGESAIDLHVRALTSPVLNGEAGLSRKSGTPGNASYYYSLPRMETEGTVRIGGESFAVTGLSWFDREWSTSALEPGQMGWDWFALQLNDGRDLMFYRLRKSDGSIDPFSSGTLVAADGRSSHLAADEVTVEVIDWWRSPESGVVYPSRWRLRIPRQGLDLEIVPLVANQELPLSFRYWEGAVDVRGAPGSPGGAGYVELTGYGAAKR